MTSHFSGNPVELGILPLNKNFELITILHLISESIVDKSTQVSKKLNKWTKRW